MGRVSGGKSAEQPREQGVEGLRRELAKAKPPYPWVLESRLATIAQEQCCSSETLSPFFSQEGDALDDIATNFDLDSVTPEEVNEAKLDLYFFTQDALKERGFPEHFTVWRCGALSGDVTSVTYDERVARRGCKGGYYGHGDRTVRAYQVARKDILLDVSSLWPNGFQESELLVHPDALEPIRSENPSNLKARLLR